MNKEQMGADQRADRDNFFKRLTEASWDAKDNFNNLFEEGFSVLYQAVLSYKNKFGTLKAKYSVENVSQIRLDIETKKITIPVTILFETSSDQIVNFLIRYQNSINSSSIKENLEILLKAFNGKIKVNLNEEFKTLDYNLIEEISKLVVQKAS
jgi:hypothetical protein